MASVESWIMKENARTLEGQMMYKIAAVAEGYLNGVRDGDYSPMTRAEWIEYINYGIVADATEGAIVNGNEFKHLMFYGKENRMSMIETYVDNYEGIKKNTVLG